MEQRATYSTDQGMAILKVIADDKTKVYYRPALNKLTNSVTATILLQQVLYWWFKNGGEPFYKFKEPCNHEDYREGDSWCEELGFTRREFDGALAKIGVKVTRGTSKKGALSKTNAYIVYWTDASRKTYYMANMDLLGKGAFALYLEEAKTAVTLNGAKRALPLPKEDPGEVVSLRRNLVASTKNGDSKLIKKEDAKSAKVGPTGPEIHDCAVIVGRALGFDGEAYAKQNWAHSQAKQALSAGHEPRILKGCAHWMRLTSAAFLARQTTKIAQVIDNVLAFERELAAGNVPDDIFDDDWTPPKPGQKGQPNGRTNPRQERALPLVDGDNTEYYQSNRELQRNQEEYRRKHGIATPAGDVSDLPF